MAVNIVNSIACGCCGRFHKAAGDATKQAAKLQAEAKAATAQSDAASATAEDAKGLARRLDMKTGHLRRNTSTAAGQVLLLSCLVVVICFLVSGNVPLKAVTAFPLQRLVCGAWLLLLCPVLCSLLGCCSALRAAFSYGGLYQFALSSCYTGTS